jgi:hypothetical protein
MQEGRVIPLLLDIEFKDVSGPLAQFQAKKVDKNGLSDVVISINRLATQQVSDARLDQLFTIMWPQLENSVLSIPEHASPAKQSRPQHEILEELVSSIRGLDSRFREPVDDLPRLRQKKTRFSAALLDELSYRLKLRPSDPLRALILTSFVRDDLPWLYELGLDVYRASSVGRPGESRKARERFLMALHVLQRGHFLDNFGGDNSLYELIKELGRVIDFERQQLDTPGSSEAENDERD